ncbi:MAG: glycosyltransferase [Candidatus Eremiobacteraeota bacterium]|nr:glycosyltransferase [Candidatus Eremiobacteraeota bacterium]
MKEWEGRWRIGMFTNVYLPTTNGVVVSVETFRRALTQLGHDVFIFGPDSGDIEDRAPFIFRYPAVELPLQKYPLTLPVSPFVDHVIKNLKPQVLHANHPALLGRVAVKKSQELDLPLVYTYHTRYADYSHYADPLPQENVKEFIDSWLGQFMSNCHHVVVPSESIKQMLFEKYRVAKDVSVVPTGIDLDKFSDINREETRRELGWSDDKTYLVSIGRLAKEKSFDILIKSFAKVERDDLMLVIIGSGDEKENLEELAADLGVAERVIFTGLIPFGEVPRYLSASDLFVFASITETQGLVTLEAMACGLPVVAVDASGTREAVDEESSILTDHDVDAMAAGIEKMLSSEDLGPYKRAARKRAESFGLLRQGEAMVEVYEKAREAHAAKRKVLTPSEDHKDRWKEFIQIFGI